MTPDQKKIGNGSESHPYLGWTRLRRSFKAATILIAVLAAAVVFVLSRPHPPSGPPARVLVTFPTPAPLLPLPLLATNDPPTFAPESMPDSPDRVADARARCGARLAQRFAAAGLTYPAREIYLRVFKHEGQLELWARSTPSPAPFRLVTAYPILRASGRLGPKRREGDGQVPEGFYRIDRFNPRSLFHLSLGLNYPNASDRLLTDDPEHPGTDIFIHGDAQSVGCMAMGDAVAEEIYLAATDVRDSADRPPEVHIFPCRMDTANCQTLLAPLAAGRPGLKKLWNSLREGYERFEHTRQLPVVRVNERGEYRVE